MTASPSVLQIILRHGIYRVTRDGVFYGDYSMKHQATESADDAARGLRAAGRAVQIVMTSDKVRP